MIAKSVPSWAGTRTFATGIAYVQKHEHRRQPELVGVGMSFADRVGYASAEEKAMWTHTRGVMSVATAAQEMEAVAAASRRCVDPVQHEIIAYAKHEQPTREQMVADAERLLSALDMADHQYVMSVHTDTDDLHAHVIVNRVGLDGRANARWNERITRERVCAQIATERGWDIVLGFHNRDLVREQRGLAELPPAPTRRVFDREFNRVNGRGELPWQDAARPYVLEAVERAASWDDLRARLDAHGVVLKAVERNGKLSGLAFAEGMGQEAPGCAASRIDARCKLSALEERFGGYDGRAVTPERTPPEVARAITAEQAPAQPATLWHELYRPAILDAVDRATSWFALEQQLARPWGIVVKGVERGGQLRGLAFAAGTGSDAPGCAASRVHARCKLSALEARLGPFPGRTVSPERPAQEMQPRAVSVDTPARTVPPERVKAEAATPDERPQQREALRARVEREAAGASFVLERARGIAENARLREEYGRYRDAFFEHRRDDMQARREEAWAKEHAVRREASERRRQAKEMQRAVVRTLLPRGPMRGVAYGVVEHLCRRSMEHDRAQASARWEHTKGELARERTQAAAPLRYRDFVAERAQAGDERAVRVREYLEGQARSGYVEPHHATEEPARERGASPTVEAVRAELQGRISEEGRLARAEVWRLSAFSATYQEYQRIDDALAQAGERGIVRIQLAPDDGAPAAERLAQVERGLLRAEAHVREVDVRVQGLQEAAAHERTVATLADQPHALLREELGEIERRLVARDASLGRERVTLRPIADVPVRDAGAEIGSARAAVVEDARDKALAYTGDEWKRHDEIQQRQASYNPFARIGLEKLERSLVEGHAQRVEQAGTDAGRVFDRSGEPARIAERCRVANTERAQARGRLEDIGRERSVTAESLKLVAGARGEVDHLERERIPVSVATLDRTAEPEALTGQIRAELTRARASVGYEKQYARLGVLDRGLAERAEALERERAALGVVVKPAALERQTSDAWERFLEETKRAAGFSVVERQQLHDAREQQGHWNPLTRWEGQRTERVILDEQGMREHDAVEGAGRAFNAQVAPEITERFNEQSARHTAWEKRVAVLSKAVDGVKQERAQVQTARANLGAMQRAGVDWRTLDRVLGGEEVAQGRDVRAEIASAKDVLVQTVSATALGWELEPIVRGETRGFMDEERKAAATILADLKGVKQNAHFFVEKDLHRVLRAPEPVREQVREQRERERSLERSRDRGLSMGR